ncbi:MAG: hypothetical protein ABH950_10075 [Candidatus Altiarchaeota archaeon]
MAVTTIRGDQGLRIRPEVADLPIAKIDLMSLPTAGTVSLSNKSMARGVGLRMNRNFMDTPIKGERNSDDSHSICFLASPDVIHNCHLTTTGVASSDRYPEKPGSFADEAFRFSMSVGKDGPRLLHEASKEFPIGKPVFFLTLDAVDIVGTQNVDPPPTLHIGMRRWKGDWMGNSKSEWKPRPEFQGDREALDSIRQKQTDAHRHGGDEAFRDEFVADVPVSSNQFTKSEVQGLVTTLARMVEAEIIPPETRLETFQGVSQTNIGQGRKDVPGIKPELAQTSESILRGKIPTGVIPMSWRNVGEFLRAANLAGIQPD